MFEIIEGYFEDFNGRKIKLNKNEAQLMFNHFESSNIKKQQRQISTSSSTNSSKNKRHHRRSKSTITTGASINYVERPSIPSLPSTQKSSIVKKKPPTPPVLTNEKLNEFVSNIYGTARSITSNSSSRNHQERNSSISTTTTVVNPTYISAFRYMKSSVNPKFLQEYRDAY
ncbi:unnamed protein product [Rotaria sp. Silwood2]|nr:unnamed protein product [Rotaria sp. Silwood2]